ncbi:hypothetical protein [Spiroplasma endosymbiont of Panorpa germanica]|uniref:hypothetical protein n=1 Tax=Spiroplasma endosymbiont of Panorpa germanica TaxID=3066314 RepID=UPI0030CA8E99
MNFLECSEVIAGAGLSGAVFSGIGSIISGVTDLISTIAGITFMFMHGTNAVSGSYKTKAFSTTWDNSEKIKAESLNASYNNLIVF